MQQRSERTRCSEKSGGECRHLEEFLFVPPVSCHCVTAKTRPACVCVVASMVLCAHRQSCEQYQVTGPKPPGDFHILTFEQIFGGDQEREEGRITEREKEEEGLEPRALLLLASSQRLF